MSRSQQDRASRYDLRIPLEFIGDGCIVRGNCVNISESGLVALFERPLDLWTTGEIRLHAGRHSCKISARVARVQDREAGLAFRIGSDASDRSLLLIRALIEEARDTGTTFTPPF
jgi:hypothetical protein